MGFVRYTKSIKSYVPKISIWTRGQIGFNQGAVEKFHIHDYTYAILYYDAEERKIGIQFTNDPNEKGAIKIVKTSTGSSISAKSFLGINNLLHNKTMNYTVQYNESDNMYIIDLKEKESVQ